MHFHATSRFIAQIASHRRVIGIAIYTFTARFPAVHRCRATKWHYGTVVIYMDARDTATNSPSTRVADRGHASLYSNVIEWISLPNPTSSRFNTGTSRVCDDVNRRSKLTGRRESRDSPLDAADRVTDGHTTSPHSRPLQLTMRTTDNDGEGDGSGVDDATSLRLRHPSTRQTRHLPPRGPSLDKIC